MYRLLFSFLIVTSICSAVEAREYQYLTPEQDQEFLAMIGMWDVNTPAPERFNLLIVGQDTPPASGKKKRSPLGSRADILMVLSIELATGQMDILSLYRDNPVTQGCINKLGYTPSYTDKINGVYSVGGRKQFIPCLEGMLEERLSANPELSYMLDSNNGFEIHSFWEGTRDSTIRPVAKDSLGIVLDNKFAFTTTYGFSAISAALNVLWKGNDLQQVLNAEGEVEVKDSDVDAKYLSVELKERKIYPAGGYQRAFNFAVVIANVLGWSAYGIEQYASYNYDFMGKFFGDVINNNFSRSHNFFDLEQKVFMRNGNHVLRHACYINNNSPIRIYQWVENSARIYAKFENGVITTNRRGTLLDKLKTVDILPNPPSCE